MKKQIGELASRDAVLQAIREYDNLGKESFLKKYNYTSSFKYRLKIDDRFYDAQAIVGAAFFHEFGEAISQGRIESNVLKIPDILAKLGFTDVDERQHPGQFLVKGNVYTRTKLTQIYGGQLQSGIWTPREFPVVFIFSGESGTAYGYHDRWTPDGVFEYVGEGQSGDMQFTKGNRALAEHRKNGEDLLMFKDLGKGKGVRYEGLFECIGTRIDSGFEKALDEFGNKKKRAIIVFALAPVDTYADDEVLDERVPTHANFSLDDLRKAALVAASPIQETKRSSETKQSWYIRSQTVRSYVLARANGHCEACGKPAPFIKKNGEPYLETHHTTRLTDQGLDHPDSVAAICPTCHRHIHSGVDGAKINERLKQMLQQRS